MKTEWTHEEKPVVLFEIPRASHAPVRFGSEEFIRVGSLKKKLKDYPTKEAELWASFSKNPFEHGIAKADLPGDELLSLLDFAGCFDLLGILFAKNLNQFERLSRKALRTDRAGVSCRGSHVPREGRPRTGR